MSPRGKEQRPLRAIVAHGPDGAQLECGHVEPPLRHRGAKAPDVTRRRCSKCPAVLPGLERTVEG